MKEVNNTDNNYYKLYYKTKLINRKLRSKNISKTTYTDNRKTLAKQDKKKRRQ